MISTGSFVLMHFPPETVFSSCPVAPPPHVGCVCTAGFFCQYKERPIVLLFGLRVSESPTLQIFLSSVKPCYSSPHWFNPKTTSCVLKRLSSRPPGMVEPFVFLLHMGLQLCLFSAPGLHNQCGEMAGGKLRSDPGDLCRSGCHRGTVICVSAILISPLIDS